MLEDERYQANLKGLLPFIYIIPSYIAHVVVIVAIFSKRYKEELGTNFFRLYAFSAVTAILSSIFLFIYSRMRYIPCLLFFFHALPERSIFGTFLYIASYYFIYAELFVSLMLNINRATVVLLKTHYGRFWKKWLAISMIALYLISVIFIIHMCFTDVSLKLINPSDPDKGYDWSERQKLVWLKNSYIMLGIVAFVAIGSVAANLYVLIYLIMTSKNNSKTFDDTQKGNKDAQKRLFIFTGIMLINHLVFAAMQVMFLLIKDQPTIYLLISAQSYVLDFINLSPPWFLLFVSPQLRRCVLRMRLEFSHVVKISAVSRVSQMPSIAPKQQTLFTTTHNKNNLGRSRSIMITA
uniref:Serpentine receptor class gamma n=1 Tax=Panagrolaimus sp. PS1159 TaxID=55785 RepID=A0AC35GD30_9BILA